MALNGQTQERKNNVVTVSDQFTDASSAALLAPEAIADSGQASVSALVSNGFDLHFTPGKNRIGGLRNIGQSYRAETDSALHESALLLASTMEAARKMKDVTWISERGGSGVLTQAMRILKDKGVSFENSGHRAFFSKLQTNLGSAEQLARDIGLTFDGKSHSKELINVNQLVGSGLFGGFVNPIRRYRKDDKYSALNMLSDMKAEGFAHKEAVGAVMGTGAVLAGVQASALGLGTAFASLSGPGMVFGAVVATATASAALYKGATAVTKSYFPLASHKKLIGK